MLRRVLVSLLLVLAVAGGLFFRWLHRPRPPLSEARVVGDQIPVWDGTGAVRRRLAQLEYGTAVLVLREYRDLVQVRGPNGLTGWVARDDLADAAVWTQALELVKRVQSLPVQARGRTRVPANLRLEPGRSAPRLAQLPRETPVEVFLRRVVAQEESAGLRRREEWLLVRAQHPPVGVVAGWVLGRFVAFDLPEFLPEYAAAADMQPVAWFTLHGTEDPLLGHRPYYLVLGLRRGQNSLCDFTMIRVYTWSVGHRRYETAYVEDDLCGKLPAEVRVLGPEESIFQFAVETAGASIDRTYRMRQTLVRLLKGSARSATMPAASSR
jgi:hypothetical protein